MKIYIVWYIHSSYHDTIQEIFADEEKAKEYILTHCPEHDRQNYYVSEADVNV